MNPHVIMLATFGRLIEWLKAFQCRKSYCLLSVVNYTNGLIIASWLFSAYGLALDVMYCVSSSLFGVAITGLYLNRPALMLPDVIYKITVSFCGLFYAIQEADAATGDISAWSLILVSVAVILQFTENYVLFQSLSAIQREMQELSSRRPPPNYDQLSALELYLQNAASTTAKIAAIKEADEHTRPETPPPCYEIAVEVLKLQSR